MHLSVGEATAKARFGAKLPGPQQGWKTPWKLRCDFIIVPVQL